MLADGARLLGMEARFSVAAVTHCRRHGASRLPAPSHQSAAGFGQSQAPPAVTGLRLVLAGGRSARQANHAAALGACQYSTGKRCDMMELPHAQPDRPIMLRPCSQAADRGRGSTGVSAFRLQCAGWLACKETGNNTRCPWRRLAHCFALHALPSNRKHAQNRGGVRGSAGGSMCQLHAHHLALLFQVRITRVLNPHIPDGMESHINQCTSSPSCAAF